MPAVGFDDVVARIKTETSIERLVMSSGVVLEKRGKDLVGLCPFHDDTDPSLIVSPGKNLWNCLGACSSGGSVIDWVMRAEGVSFRHAVELLRDGHEAVGDQRKPGFGIIENWVLGVGCSSGR